MTGMEERQSVSGAYAKIEGHEALCAERYEGIKNAISDLKSTAKWSGRGIIALLVSILGWALVQLYTLQPLRQVPSQSVTISTTTPTVRHMP